MKTMLREITVSRRGNSYVRTVFCVGGKRKRAAGSPDRGGGKAAANPDGGKRRRPGRGASRLHGGGPGHGEKRRNRRVSHGVGLSFAAPK